MNQPAAQPAARDATITHDVAARLLKLPPRDLEELVKDGVIPRQGPQQYVLALAVHAYIDHLRARIDGNETLGQAELGQRLDMSDRNLRDVLTKLDLDHRTTPAREITVAYIRHLREQAAGRVLSDARERRDAAQARESEANAALKERELYRQDGLIVDIDSVRLAISDWIATACNEFNGAIDKIVAHLETEHGITIDTDALQQCLDDARRAIADYRWQHGPAGDDHLDGVDTAA